VHILQGFIFGKVKDEHSLDKRRNPKS